MNKVKVKIDFHTNELFALMVVWLAFIKSAFSERIHIIFTGIGIISGIVLLWYCLLKLMIPVKIFWVWLVFGACGLINYCFVGTLSLQNLLTMAFLYFPISIYIYFSENLNIILWDLSYFIYSIYVIYRMLNSVDGYLMFYRESRNSLSVLLIAWLFIAYIVKRKKGQKLKLIHICFFVIGCFIANGRGGIVSAGILAIAYFLINFLETRGNKNYIWVVRYLALSILAVGILNYLFQNYQRLFEKYLWRFTDINSVNSTRVRIQIWALYLKQCVSNIESFLLGGNTYNMLRRELDGNLHNSYLMSHACLGICGMCCIVYCFAKGLINELKAMDLWSVALTITFFSRAATDRIFPGKIGDICMWIVILQGICNYDNFNQSYT